MPKKHRFRKMYFVCTDNRVISDNVLMTNVYQRKNDTEKIAKQRDTHWMWEDETKPIAREHVEGFYLVHESLYDELLKEHDINGQ